MKRCAINDEKQPIGVCLGVGTIGEWCSNCIYYVFRARDKMKTKINVEAVSNDADALTQNEQGLCGPVVRCPLCGLIMAAISDSNLVCLDCGVIG